MEREGEKEIGTDREERVREDLLGREKEIGTDREERVREDLFGRN